MAPCNPDVCPYHKAHEQALSIGSERFEKIDEKLETLLSWKSEMKGVWLATVAAIGLVSTTAGVLVGAGTAYIAIHPSLSVDKVSECATPQTRGHIR